MCVSTSTAAASGDGSSSLGDHTIAVDAARLKPILKVTGAGPGADIIDLAEWASVRWAAGRIRPFLVTASPERAVVGSRRPSRATTPVHGPTSPATLAILEARARDGDADGGVLRLPPRADVMPTLLSAASFARRTAGTVLVIAPSQGQVAHLSMRLARGGLTVATMPHDWAAARAGVDVVIGSRSAAWAPCAGLAVAVVLDEHDEALQEERTPTWHARDVLAERCRRAGVPLLLVSPTPRSPRSWNVPARRASCIRPERERAGWPIV